MESDYEEHDIVGSKICNDLRNYHDMHIFHVSAFQSDLTASGRSFFWKNNSFYAPWHGDDGGLLFEG